MTLVILFIIALVFLIPLIIIRVRIYGSRYMVNLNDLSKDNDAIIVLGAGIRKDGTPSDILADRLKTSVEIFVCGFASKFVLSGDYSGEEYDEVGAMKQYIIEHYNIDEKTILMDHAGFSTYETMYRAKKLFQVKKAVIVTNEYHLPRALYIARRLGIEAYGVKSDKRKYDLMDSYKKREILAQLKDFIYVNILRPKFISNWNEINKD